MSPEAVEIDSRAPAKDIVFPVEALSAILRLDLLSFVAKAFDELHRRPLERADYLELITRKLTEAVEGRTRRLIINLPPRVLKSHTVSVCLPAFILGHQPNAKILLISHDQGLVEGFAHGVRTLLRAPWYRAAFPRTELSSDFAQRAHFKTTQGGELLATALGAGFTGEGGDIVIIDDPLDAQHANTERRVQVNDLFDSKMESRLNNRATGQIIVVAQRLHPEDLVGYLEKKGTFEKLVVPLIAEEATTYEVGAWRWERAAGDVLRPLANTAEEIAALKRTLAPHVFLTQYQQAATLLAAGLVKPEWFQRYQEVLPAAEQRVLSWDLGQTASATSSFSVCLAFRTDGKGHFLTEVWRRQVEFTDLKLHAADLVRRHPGAIHLVEEAALGYALIGELRAANVKVEGIKPSARKQDRMEAVLDLLSGGAVHLPIHASWLDDFLAEVTQFPFAPYDDQSDALSQFLNWMRNDFQPRPPPSFGHGAGALPGHAPRHPLRDPRAPPRNFIRRGRSPFGA